MTKGSKGRLVLFRKHMLLTEPVNISNDKSRYSAEIPQAIMSEHSGLLYVIWHKSRGIFGGWQQAEHDKNGKSASIVYRVSNNNGKTFSDTYTLYEFKDPDIFGTHISFAPYESCKRAFLTWVDRTSPNKLDVFFSKDSDDGGRLEEPIIITDQDSGITDADSSDMQAFVEGKKPSFDGIVPYITAAGSEQVYIMWIETKTTKSPRETTKDEDNSVPRLPPQSSFTAKSEEELNEKLNEHWKNRRRHWARSIPGYQISMGIFFRGSDDGGRTFGKKINILKTIVDSPGGPYLIGPVSLLAAGNNVYIITNALSYDSPKARLFRSIDNGNSFEENKHFLSSAENSEMKVVAVRQAMMLDNQDTLYLLATLASQHEEQDLISSPFERPKHKTILVKSFDGGATFSGITEIPDGEVSAGPMGSPFAVSRDGNHLYIASKDMGTGPFEMLKTARQRITPERLQELTRDYHSLAANDAKKKIGENAQRDTAGTILIRSSSDGGTSFSDPIRLNDSKHIGLVAEFGVNVVLLPFRNDCLLVLKTRDINTRNRQRPDSSHMPGNEISGEDNTSEVLLWVSRDGGRSFEGPTVASHDIKHSKAAWGSIVIEGSEEERDSVALYFVWTAGSLFEYSDVYFRTLRI